MNNVYAKNVSAGLTLTFTGAVTSCPGSAKLPLVNFNGLQWYLEPRKNSLAASCFVPAWAARVVPTEDEATFRIVTHQVNVELPQHAASGPTKKFTADLEIHTLVPKPDSIGEDVEVTRAKHEIAMAAEAAAAAARAEQKYCGAKKKVKKEDEREIAAKVGAAAYIISRNEDPKLKETQETNREAKASKKAMMTKYKHLLT